MTAPLPAVEAIIAELRAMGSEANRIGLEQFGINAKQAFGISMTALRPVAKRLGRNHTLAGALWRSGHHEARLLAIMVDEPSQVTEAQMDRWVADVDSWDVCDQACIRLFVKTPFAEEAVRRWAGDEREFVRRAAFALIAALAVHGKAVPDLRFLDFLALIERHAGDRRNFVKKAVNWALRQIGKRSPALHAPALALAERLRGSPDPAARWIGKDAVRELTDPMQIERVRQRASSD